LVPTILQTTTIIFKNYTGVLVNIAACTASIDEYLWKYSRKGVAKPSLNGHDEIMTPIHAAHPHLPGASVLGTTNTA